MTTEIDYNRCRVMPYQHQKESMADLIEWDNKPKSRTIGGCFFLGLEMGLGKSKVVIDSAQVLFERGLIDTVLVIAPASVRDVWYDPELGQLAGHLWLDVPNLVTEVHARERSWQLGPDKRNALRWIITNYEFIRTPKRLDQFKKYTGLKTLMVLDESGAVKNDRAKQTRATRELRNKCGRVVLLNGTPIENTPMDLFSQARLMDPAILACPSFFVFRARYAVISTQGGFPRITGYQNLPDLQNRLKPYIVRRLKADCLDLPEKIPSVVLSVAMTDETWAMYKQMRDDFIAWLDNATVSTAGQAVVKAMRLAQITAGFLGGINEAHPKQHDLLEDDDDDLGLGDEPDWLRELGETLGQGSGLPEVTREPMPQSNPTLKNIESPTGAHITTREIGREKLDFLLEWIAEQLVADPKLKLLVWCRFKLELLRYVSEFQKAFPLAGVGALTGGQKKDERTYAKRLLDPRTAPDKPVIVVGSQRAGGKGLGLAACHTVIYASNEYSLGMRKQSEDRVHRPGQVHKVSYFDIVATGPAGQKTIDHAAVKALWSKDEIATWTMSAWRQALTEE